ncbi:hypothetical protein [Brevundimonas sp. NPDC046655]|uniref:hypothetical protein n=1 Tax=unclassified Brevundimonas TaxID=2622653 RepID=UPI00384DCD3D
MTSYRWTTHRVYDASHNDKSGLAAISMWWLARAAAEETMQGSPLAAAWLKLFRTQLSQEDSYWLRWRGDLAESAELRRAYSGLYGRFVARALLKEHLGLSRFLSLKRNGISVPGAIDVVRNGKGDIPDWLAWDDRNSAYVLGEAKGSLTATDFLSTNGPKCVREGKDQFARVTATESGVIVTPGQWVAATRWATDDRRGNPATVLWDPPVEPDPNRLEFATRRREAMTRAWLESLAPSLGYRDAAALLSPDRGREAVIITAKPGPIPEGMSWPVDDDRLSVPTAGKERETDNKVISSRRTVALMSQRLSGNLDESEVYRDSSVLAPKEREAKAHEGAYIAAVITRFGVRPIRSAGEFETLKREQERAQSLEEPGMVVGIPLALEPQAPATDRPWLDDAGIAQAGELSLFDLRVVDVERAT